MERTECLRMGDYFVQISALSEIQTFGFQHSTVNLNRANQNVRNPNQILFGFQTERSDFDIYCILARMLVIVC